MERRDIYSYIAITGFYALGTALILGYGDITYGMRPVNFRMITPVPTLRPPAPTAIRTPLPEGIVLVPKDLLPKPTPTETPLPTSIIVVATPTPAD